MSGRYIDADALLKTFNDFPCLWVQYTIAGHSDEDIKNIVSGVLKKAKETIIAEINAQPTADVVEVKHGRWIKDRLCSTSGGTYGVRRCSVCEDYYQDVGYGWNYCPNCGSDMRGAEE